MLETSINWLLQQDPTINSAIQGRITPFNREDDNLFPAVTYQKSGFFQEKYIDGSYSSIEEHSIDLDIWAKSYSEVKALSEQIAHYLLAFSGDANGVNIQAVLLNGFSESAETDPDHYLITLNFTIYTKKEG